MFDLFLFQTNQSILSTFFVDDKMRFLAFLNVWILQECIYYFMVIEVWARPLYLILPVKSYL